MDKKEKTDEKNSEKKTETAAKEEKKLAQIDDEEFESTTDLSELLSEGE